MLFINEKTLSLEDYLVYLHKGPHLIGGFKDQI